MGKGPMTHKQLIRLQAKIDALREQGSVKPAELESIATSLQRSTSGSGKHPMWKSNALPSRPPLSIPNHSKELNRFTARQILEQLEEDIIQMQRVLPPRKDSTDENTDENDSGEKR